MKRHSGTSIVKAIRSSGQRRRSTWVSPTLNWGFGWKERAGKGNEHLVAPVIAFRSALEVRTREQLPQGWATTQNNLGNALGRQAARTEGTKGVELLSQAVAAYRSALEVYSAEAFPLFHEGTEKQLKECERVLMQAKLKLNKVKQRSQ